MNENRTWADLSHLRHADGTPASTERPFVVGETVTHEHRWRAADIQSTLALIVCTVCGVIVQEELANLERIPPNDL